MNLDRRYELYKLRTKPNKRGGEIGGDREGRREKGLFLGEREWTVEKQGVRRNYLHLYQILVV